MKPMMRTSAAGGILFAVMLVDAGAQAPDTANAVAPVALYLRASNADGDPVTDLTSSDVTVRIGGQPRTVRSIDLLDFRQPADARPATATQATGWPPPFTTNDGAGGGRDLVIALDDASLSQAAVRSLQESLGQLLDGVSARDRVGLMSVRGGGVNIGLTTRHESVRAAVASLSAQGGATEPCRAASILETLKNLIGSLKGASPATVVFFSSGAAQIDQCGVRMEQWRALGAVVERTFSAFYIAQVFEGMGARSGFLDSLAGMGSGELIRLTGDTSRPMARIVRETQVSYRLLVEPDAKDRNGTTQRLELRTARAGIKLAAPGAVTFGPAAAPAAKSTNPGDLLRGGLPPPDLRLRAAAFPSRNPGDDKVRVVAMFEPTDPAVKIASAAVAMFDGREQSAAQWTARRSDLARAPVLTALPVPAGTYRMRVAAVDANGRAGAVDLNVDATLVEGKALKLSAIVLGAIQDGALNPKLQFGTEPSAVAYVEIYGTAPGTLSARFEVAVSASRQMLAPIEAQVRRLGTDDTHAAQAIIPISSLPAGDALIRAIVSVNGTPAAQITRTLRKQ